MKQLENAADIHQLVSVFYDKVLQDELLAPFSLNWTSQHTSLKWKNFGVLLCCLKQVTPQTLLKSTYTCP